jgi:hypothetical protein
MCNRFKKHAFKSAKAGFESKPPLAIFKANERHIRCLAHLINLSAQAILTYLKSTAKKHTSMLYNNTKFLDKPTYSSAISKLC